MLARLHALAPGLQNMATSSTDGVQRQWPLKLAVQGGHVEAVRLLQLGWGAMCACYHFEGKEWEGLPEVGPGLLPRAGMHGAWHMGCRWHAWLNWSVPATWHQDTSDCLMW